MVSLNILATALLCSTAFAAYARTVADLDLKVNHEFAGWVNVRDKDKSSFNAEIHCEVASGTLEVGYLINSESKFKNPEALLAIWKEVTGTDASNMRYIEYDSVDHKTTNNVLETIWKNNGINPKDKYIPSRKVYRPSSGETSWEWSSLRSTRHGTDVIDFCTDYEDTDKLRIESFEFGKSTILGRWLRISVSPWTPSLDD